MNRSPRLGLRRIERMDPVRYGQLPAVTTIRVLALITALVFLLPATGLAVQGRTADGPADRTADATGSRPKPPATGHLHLLAAPARVADSRSGMGLPKRPFATDSGSPTSSFFRA